MRVHIKKHIRVHIRIHIRVHIRIHIKKHIALEHIYRNLLKLVSECVLDGFVTPLPSVEFRLQLSFKVIQT